MTRPTLRPVTNVMTKNKRYQFGEYHHFSLDNGLRVVAERHSYARSVSVGLWVRLGSSYEDPNENGASHFIEHMVFKGTKRRTAEEIATVLESRGGDLNAFTDREFTCFHATVLKDDLELAVEVLADLALSPAFEKTDFDRERRVLLQELAMLEDAPDERVFDLFASMVWKGEPLGQPVIGSKKTISKIKLSKLAQFHSDNYCPEKMVLAIAGNYDLKSLESFALRHLGEDRSGQRTFPGARLPSRFRAARRSVVADIEQQHLLIGYEALGLRDEDRYDALVLCVYLGGGMGSRLFQEVREKKGLAYSVEAELMPFTESGVLSIYAALEPKSVKSYLNIVARELERLRTQAIAEKDLDRVKGQIRGSILLSSEFMDSRQESLGRNQLIFGRYLGVGEVIDAVDRVTSDGVERMAGHIFQKKKESVLTMGRRNISAQALRVL